ncbi:FAD-binding oxidoreductase [Vogesella sp. LIG4]|uniref:FAD-binding oxidoreductase n=1 Tax=Vogesella sp. LIG4 TaxID=1192162 RepID=UPI00081F8EF1|nr:FAD-binding oxidoreductase [Vogesella sp. LIG4]SCK29005.1 FAD/FMN-containing dehydrogenase [Vogesella sp. LIG4]
MSSSLSRLQQTLPQLVLRTDDDSLRHYGLDWTRYYQPAPLAIALPATIAEVQGIVRWAREQQVTLVPSGGRTGLSGGAVAANGELVVSFERMNRIGNFDRVARTVQCEAGVVTAALQQYAADKGLYYPVDFAASGSSQLGGNIATNAGGIKVIRYGMTREWVAGLTVVTGAGEVLELNRGLAKNNTGYDFRHLFIGSEGTLGFVVGATMKLTLPPAPQAVLLLALPALADVMRVFEVFREGIALSAFEFFSDQALGHVLAHGQLAPPFEKRAPFYVLLELDDPAHVGDATALKLFERCLEQGWVLDGVLSLSLQHARELWRYRENISESITPYTPYKNDIAVNISRVPAFIASLDALLAANYPDFEVIWYGHIGDGNLHINVLKPPTLALEAFRAACEQVNEQVFALVRDFGGSMSAEHGVGLLKRDYLAVSRSDAEIALMRSIKAAFDPDGIMNPGKLLS